RTMLPALCFPRQQAVSGAAALSPLGSTTLPRDSGGRVVDPSGDSAAKAEAALALHRFGFGPRGGSIAAIASDPRGALMAELDRPGAGRITDPDLLTSGEAARAAFKFRQERRAQRLAARAQREDAKNATEMAQG